MMHQDDESPLYDSEASGSRTVLDLPLLSRDDFTWKQFSGTDNVAESALRGAIRTILVLVQIRDVAFTAQPPIIRIL